MQEVKLEVIGMSCHHCEMHINNALKDLDGLTFSSASAEANEVIVKYDSSKLDLDKIKQTIIETGYEVK